MSDIPPNRLFPGRDPAHQLNAPPLVGSPEFIQSDVYCSQCQYNLRGQPRDGRCPECGTSVMEAFRRGQLIYCDAAWLRRVRSGVALVLWAIVASILLTCAFSMFGVWIAVRHPPGSPSQIPTWINFPSAVLGILGVVFAMVVLYRLTAPEPQPGDPAPTRRTGLSRIIIRLAWVALFLQLVNAPVFLILGPDPSPSMPLSPAFLIYTGVVGGLGSILYVTVFVMLLLHLRAIARRDATPALGKLFTVLIWGGAICLAAVFIGGFAILLMTAGAGQHISYWSTTMTAQSGGASWTIATTTSNSATSSPAGGVTTTTTGSHVASTALFFYLFPILALAECGGFIVFILGIVAAIQFYRALSRAITHNVGIGNVFAVSPPPGADNRPSG